MKVCRVLGPVVSTIKHPTYHGLKLLIVEPVDREGAPASSSFLAVDRIESGPGDLVLVMQEGGGVRQLFGIQELPIRSIIVGFIDAMDFPQA